MTVAIIFSRSESDGLESSDCRELWWKRASSAVCSAFPHDSDPGELERKRNRDGISLEVPSLFHISLRCNIPRTSGERYLLGTTERIRSILVEGYT